MVHFVGAGPGAADLITVRGKELLEQADVIIYAGSLVNKELLKYAGEDCEIYNSAEMHLTEIADIMVKAEREGKRVVRLHTGDPSLYGAIKEQMDLLSREGIDYRVCPGVSSFSGAAAALDLEYTLPGVSQSVIITRMEGRTPMPEKEKLHMLAEHGCTMVLFLSTGLLEQVREELLKGAYQPATPCAIVYKATWQEEKVVRGTLEQLPDMARENQITKTALIIVGNVLESDYELSKLYDAGFTTEFRKAVPKNPQEKKAVILSFTERGGEQNQKLLAQMREQGISCTGYTLRKYQRPGLEYFQNLKELIAKIFYETDMILFISAAGIAVRSVAPFLKGKETDPAVLVMDEAGKHVISLLSGHLGGANDWCSRIASLTGADPVITTATDVNHIFSVDSFAKANGLIIRDLTACKEVSARLLAGEKIAVLSDYELEDELPERLVRIDRTETAEYECGIYINSEEKKNEKPPFPVTCELLAGNLYLGVGCRKGKGKEELEEFLADCLREQGLTKDRLAAIGSVAEKADEEGICRLAAEMELPFLIFTAEELKAAEGSFQESAFVESTVGVGNVCERAAVLGSEGGRLLMRKTCRNGMTFAIAEKEKKLRCCM